MQFVHTEQSCESKWVCDPVGLSPVRMPVLRTISQQSVFRLRRSLLCASGKCTILGRCHH